MTSSTIRPFVAADLDHLLRLAVEGDAADVDRQYLAYVARTGSLLVAVDAAGRPIAFGGVVDVPTPDGSAAMVSDLFVDAASRGAGVGGALLGRLLRGRPLRMTCSSAHPAALPAYRSAGMTPVGRLLYLVGHGRAEHVRSHTTTRDWSPVADGDWAHDRGDLVDHFRDLGAGVGRHMVIDVSGDAAGTTVAVRRLHVDRVADARSSMDALLGHLAVSTRVEVCVPEWQPLAAWLVEQRFVEVDRDIVCTTPGLRLDPCLAVVSPGLW